MERSSLKRPLHENARAWNIPYATFWRRVLQTNRSNSGHSSVRLTILTHNQETELATTACFFDSENPTIPFSPHIRKQDFSHLYGHKGHCSVDQVLHAWKVSVSHNIVVHTMPYCARPTLAY